MNQSPRSFHLSAASPDLIGLVAELRSVVCGPAIDLVAASNQHLRKT